MDRPLRSIVAQDSLTVLTDTLECVARQARFLPATRQRLLTSQLKIQQFQLAQSIGFEIPATLVTNDVAEARDFIAGHGDLITKSASGAGLEVGGNSVVGLGRNTERLVSADLLHLHDIELCPVTIQAAVAKKLELRVIVVGERVFSAAIDSQETHHTVGDFRRYDSLRPGVCLFPDLPDEVSDHLVQLTKRLGLSYSASDLILTPDGRYVFLELNPSGEYFWIEEATELPITEAIADYLTGIR